MENDLEEAIELIAMGTEEGDDDIVQEAEASLTALEIEAARRQLESLFQAKLMVMIALLKSMLALAALKLKTGLR